MSEIPKTPWHLWVVGIITLIWNGFGGLDFIMTQTRNPDYMAQFTPEQLEYFTSFPAWVNVTWAVGVWGAVLGSILLLLRTKWAEPVLWLSIVGMLITSAQNFVFSDTNMIDLMGPVALTFSAAILVVAVLLALYARWMRRQGVLR